MVQVFKSYIELELQLGNIDRVRSIYEKQLESFPANCRAWIAFAELEQSLGELDRARAIFELGIAQPLLDMPELLWKAYIDFEIAETEHEHARALYTRLLDRTSHVKVSLTSMPLSLSLPPSLSCQGLVDEHACPTHRRACPPNTPPSSTLLHPLSVLTVRERQRESARARQGVKMEAGD